MSDIIDLTERRNAKEQPDPECIRKDEYGRPLYLFTLEYRMPDGAYGAEIWAYSIEDAEARVTAMRSSLTVLGQIHCIIPA